MNPDLTSVLLLMISRFESMSAHRSEFYTPFPLAGVGQGEWEPITTERSKHLNSTVFLA